MRSAFFQGLSGELAVVDTIRQLPAELNCYVVHNVPLRNAKGTYYQIDAVLLCNRGFFCIEAKTWTGCVYASMEKVSWAIDYDGTLYYQRNPIRQNAVHVRYLGQKLGQDFENLIVFPNTTTVMGDVYGVLHLFELSSYLLQRPVTRQPDIIQSEYNRVVRLKESLEIGLLADRLARKLGDET